MLNEAATNKKNTCGNASLTPPYSLMSICHPEFVSGSHQQHRSQSDIPKMLKRRGPFDVQDDANSPKRTIHLFIYSLFKKLPENKLQSDLKDKNQFFIFYFTASIISIVKC